MFEDIWACLKICMSFQVDNKRVCLNIVFFEIGDMQYDHSEYFKGMYVSNSSMTRSMMTSLSDTLDKVWPNYSSRVSAPS